MAGDRGGGFLGVERSLGNRRWRLRVADERAGFAIAQRLGLPEIVGRVLAARGVSQDGAEAFLAPSLRACLPDPFDLPDMERAATRLSSAVREGERIALFGDYDVDGATSCALLFRFLDSLGVPPLVHVPDRLREGYGPNAPALSKLARAGARLVVVLDCGTTAHLPLKAARGEGLDVLVVDHHVAEPSLPEAFAIVNPNRLDGSGAHGELAAVGAAFLLAVATNRALREGGFYAGREEPDLFALLDLVALGTVCDVVPLIGVNRALVAQGLRVMARRRNAGLAALADVAGLSERPTAYHAAFVLGPRVNAGGRVGEADLGFRLLATDQAEEARGIAQRLDAYNAHRRALEERVLAEALALVGREAPARGLVFAAGEGWHPGVIGIVASRLVERFHRPAVVVALDGGLGKGSARSIPGVALGADVIAARQAGLLVDGGGHAMAAGFTVRRERLADLRAFLGERLGQRLDVDDLVPVLGIDGALALAGATRDLVALVERVGPFGAGNAEPRFAFKAVRAVKAEVVGGSHVRVVLADSGSGRLAGIAFRAAGTELGAALLAAGGAPLHVAGTLRADDWGGRSRVRLIIDDAARA